MTHSTRTNRTLAVRLDSDGDVLLAAPALRALRAGSRRVDLLVSPAGRQAAELLPDIDDVIVFDAPWSGNDPSPVSPRAVDHLVAQLRSAAYDDVVIFTSVHQSALPIALIARLAGARRVSATSEDYPGTLLDVRHRRMPQGAPDLGGAAGGHEVEAMLALAAAAGFPLPAGDDARLRLAPLPVPTRPELTIERRYVVLAPTASVPARSLGDLASRRIADRLAADGWTVVVTGAATGPAPSRRVVPRGGIDLVGRTTLAELAQVLAGAHCVVAVNSAPGHLAAAVGTPVVSLFAPVVPPERWAPWGVPSEVLGDRLAACHGSRARTCPVPGHPCLDGIAPDDVAAAVARLVGPPSAATADLEVAR
ncbi:MAG: glycosyltransferase family 9 protein [Intrasporangium sp.]|uniref:glycosyltransferase family 9 protein n=1 Tax=Intrasporangium sp. TaxID=1925024 RepID=UPI003F7E0E2E